MIKKALSLLLALCLLAGVFCFAAGAKEPLAASGNIGENIQWTFNSETGGLRFSGTGPLSNYEHPGDSPFSDRDEIITVIIEDGITTVGSYLFSGCTSLRHLMLGEDVKTVYYGAFMDCTSLQNVALGSSVQSIYKSAFHNTDLMNLYCANDLTWFNSTLSISSENNALQDSGTNRAFECEIDLCGETVFYAYSPKMKRTVILGSGATEDFDWDMNPSPIRNGEIQTAFICNEITHVSDWAFFGCNKLAAIDVEYANKDFVSTGGVLYNADKTVLVAYPEARAYMSVIIPQSVTEIRPGAFGEGASYLKTITLPKALKTVGYGAFEYCENLATVNYGGSKADWDKIEIDDANDPLEKAKRNVTITALDLSVAAPEIGKTPPTKITMTHLDAMLLPVTVENVTWSPADTTFQKGTSYTVTIAVKAKDGYLLPKNAAEINATINGKTAKYEFKQEYNEHMAVTQEYALISYSFPPVSGLMFFAITVEGGTANADAAKAGATVTVTANEPPKTKTFDYWEVVSGGVTLADPKAKKTTFTMPADDVHLIAHFKSVIVGPGTPEVLPGDVDGNGKIETKDARLALRCSIGLEKYEAGSPEYLACDVTKDGKVGTDDARFILRKSVGLKDPEITWE